MHLCAMFLFGYALDFGLTKCCAFFFHADRNAFFFNTSCAVTIARSFPVPFMLIVARAHTVAAPFLIRSFVNSPDMSPRSCLLVEYLNQILTR